MRIAHVVTYLSPDGAFGGPTRVALGQAASLAERGHDVTVFAASPAGSAGDIETNGFRLRTFPGRRLVPGDGFAMMHASGLTRALRNDLPNLDVVHIHLARDLVTVPAAQAARRAGVPYVVQPHGMIDASDRLLARPLDAFVTKPLLRDAHAVLVLTDQEDRDIRGVQPESRVFRVANGILIGELPEYASRKNLVLFLARLHERKRPLAFVEMSRLLAESLPDTEFVIVGPDEGEASATLEAITAAGAENRIRWAGPASPDQTDAWLSSARVYVLPSFGEVFPMTILESLRAGTPVVTTNSLGIASACQDFGAALITDGSPAELAAAVASILEQPDLAEGLRIGGHRYLSTELDIAHVAKSLEDQYVSAAEMVIK